VYEIQILILIRQIVGITTDLTRGSSDFLSYFFCLHVVQLKCHTAIGSYTHMYLWHTIYSDAKYSFLEKNVIFIVFLDLKVSGRDVKQRQWKSVFVCFLSQKMTCRTSLPVASRAIKTMKIKFNFSLKNILHFVLECTQYHKKYILIAVCALQGLRLWIMLVYEY
jgi:hypothetical protein